MLGKNEVDADVYRLVMTCQTCENQSLNSVMREICGLPSTCDSLAVENSSESFDRNDSAVTSESARDDDSKAHRKDSPPKPEFPCNSVLESASPQQPEESGTARALGNVQSDSVSSPQRASGVESSVDSPILRERRDWWYCGVNFPAGLELSFPYKGVSYFAKIDGGRWMQDGRVMSSPSAAARAVTRNSVNGWRCWRCKLPGESKWRSLNVLRSRRAR